MTTNHIDQLKEWWENAEEGIPNAGDTVIFDERHRVRGFHVTQATKDHPRGYDNARILSRAPKPKPAWQNAVAVIAHHEMRPERQVWTLRKKKDYWYGSTGDEATTWDLIDPVPLIEARVTDEMVNRSGAVAPWKYEGWSEETVRAMLTAALGLETA